MDSSSIVKLYVDEPGHHATREASSRADRVLTSLVAYPEVRAAFAAKRRNREFSERGLARLVMDFETDWPRFYSLELSVTVALTAGGLAQSYALSGLDSIHLATAMALREVSPDTVELSTFDDRLRRAALAEGFVVV